MERIKFKINGVQYTVGSEVSSSVTLLDYIREQLELRGTKYMCREGGCGTCILTAVTCPGGPPLAVNSCLVSITSCKDWDITTIEKLGNKRDDYDAIQKTLAANNGTQCGFCSPGWVMAMNSLLKSKKELTMLEIEQSFASNICRCTGYRPILESFKKFAKDVPKTDNLPDIEELNICKKTGKICTTDCNDVENEWCFIDKDNDFNLGVSKIRLKDGKTWYTASNVREIMKILNDIGDEKYMLVSGNTAKGAYPIDEYPPILIDISDVPELKTCLLDQNLIVGAGNTLSNFLNILQQYAKEQYFGYFSKLFEHISLVAHIAVRNIGTIAGNLMIKYEHKDFPSDLFLLFETVGALLTIANNDGNQKTYTMRQFLKLEMRRKVILNVLFPPLSDEYKLFTCKVMPRAQNAHAIVNAGFMYKMRKFDDCVISCRIVYGGLSSTFIRAKATEAYLKGKRLFINETLQAAIKTLESELVVTENPPEPSAAYRKQLALNLFYKGLLSLSSDEALRSRYRSGGTKIHETRKVSQGRQVYNTNPSLYPLNQPVEKIEALIQCSGEAVYTEDLPSLPDEVYGAFVLSTVPTGTIVSMDASKALDLPGVVAFYTSKDIPGLNTFSSGIMQLDFMNNEEILSSGTIKYYNQPIGIIVAKERITAEKAAKLVQVTYNKVKRPVIDIKEAVSNPNRVKLYKTVPSKEKGNDVTKVIKGDLTQYGQYHFSMETLVCVSVPTEEGLQMYSATQWIDGIQNNMSKVLNIDANRIDVYVRRLGGAFGIKISRAALVSMASGLVAYKLNRPCRFIMPLTTNTRAIGKRLPCHTQFEVAVNDSGVMQYLNQKNYEDFGHMVVEQILIEISIGGSNNCYNKARWNYDSYTVTTDLPKNTWCRSPGNLGAIAMTEWIMERISYELSLDPLKVRLTNLDDAHKDLVNMVDTLKSNSEYDQRRLKVDKFNLENRWNKRGLRFSLLRWTPVGSEYFDVNLSVYHADGSVSIVHGGVEMGQGINTKAVQICAYLLNIPMDKIKIKANNTIFTPNAFISGGSLASQNVGVGVQSCCNELLSRLEPIRMQMENPTWEELIKKAFESELDLQVHTLVNGSDAREYNIYGVALAEVEVDILTGESEVLRVDILQDVGQSVSPSIDVGQVEGAFIMGMGFWTMEKLVYDANNGDLLSNRTWDYYVPQARDIPQDFRVYFRENSYSFQLFFGAKGTGEPPMCLSVAVPIAMREAITAARLESNIPTTVWFDIVGSEVSSSVTLLDYIREQLELRGTKYMCCEGGCGTCILTAVTCPGGPPLAVNSCMVSITSCQDWDITTIEKVGNRSDGYNPIQTQLAANNGTQCGYCTPGWIMAMYSLLQSRKNLSMYEIEKSFASNICRCTGYRPILDTFKKFAHDARKISDIEDLDICMKHAKRCGKSCSASDDEWCFVQKHEVFKDVINKITLADGKEWFRVKSVSEIFAVLKATNNPYMLVSGNTAKGAYPIEEYPPILIDISNVAELKYCQMDQNLIIGAGTTLTELLDIFENRSGEDYFSYLKVLHEHLQLVAHIPVRNIGTIAGNLMTKHQYNFFPSDIFLLLDTVGAALTIVNIEGRTQVMSMSDFLKQDMCKKVILNILLQPLSDEHVVKTYKIMPRAQNAHAIVNAGFLYKLSGQYVLETRIVYGGLSPMFNRAEKTENFLKGKKLFTNETLEGAVKILALELIVEENPPEPSPMYRKRLAIGLFYKSLLSLCPEKVLNSRYRSGGSKIHASRPLSRGCQVLDTNPSLYPLNQPIPKLEALAQCAGEAQYVDDMSKLPREVFAAFVTASVPKGQIETIDATKALAHQGVVAFYSAKDIPGLNAFNSGELLIDFINNEELFCDGTVKFCNQPIGIIVAESNKLAQKAAKMVKVKYNNVSEPVIEIREAIRNPERVSVYGADDGKDQLNDVTKIIKGENTLYGQYHFCMETLVCVTRPTLDGIEVFSATHWIDAVQNVMSRALIIDESRIDIIVHRLGGSYGMKLSRATQVAIACALATIKLNRPCRFILPLVANTKAVGKRIGCTSNFEAGVNTHGVIQYINQSHYENYGYMITEQVNSVDLLEFNNCYKRVNWNYKSYTVTTDTPKNTWFRAPGTLGAVAVAEWIMEQIACELSLDPIALRLANLDSQYKDIEGMVETIILNGEYNKRKAMVEKFNIENRWKKRGLKLSLLKWTPTGQTMYMYGVTLSVYHGDGSVAISHAGVEIGQGINTKAAQVCAYLLGIPLQKVTLKSTNTMNAPNYNSTSASVTSQCICVGVRKCCEELLKRLEPVRSKMNNPTWEELITKAYESEIDLQTHGFTNTNDFQAYKIYGVALAEVEVDILTGESEILRVDLLQDVGQSVNPLIDIGQIEGAFIMGLGYWTSEDLVYDVNNGDLLTNRTWNYFVPQAKDIPQDFRVYFRKNSYSKEAYFGAKLVGEPPICLAVAVPIAIREAIVSARSDCGIPCNKWFQIDGPYTVEKICMAAGTRFEDFKLY